VGANVLKKSAESLTRKMIVYFWPAVKFELLLSPCLWRMYYG